MRASSLAKAFKPSLAYSLEAAFSSANKALSFVFDNIINSTNKVNKKPSA